MNTKSTTPKLHRVGCILFVVFVMASLLGYSGKGRSGTGSEVNSFIIQGVSAEQVSHLVEQHGGMVTSQLDIIHGVGALLSTQNVAALRAEPGITAITQNATVNVSGPRTPATDYPDVVGADLVAEQGDLGSGVTVAVVDTGLGWHPGLYTDTRGRIDRRILGWVDFVNNSRLPYDPNGHGTHVAGIIGNAQKDSENEWAGIAPGVNLVGVRVLDQEGAGTYERVIEGIQWVLDHQATYNIRIMNLSLSSPVKSPYWADPLNQAVMRAWAAGITVVVAAGNGGSGPMSVGVPGNNPYVITVGAFTDNYTPMDWNDDFIAPFSAAGPTLDGFVKPDVVAPGAHMVSTMMPNSYLARHHEANKVTSLYFSMAGTSQATGVVSGEAALILSQHPELTPDQVKFRIMVTSFLWVDPNTTEALYSMWQQGTGRVNVPDAVYADISESANAGMDIQADLTGTIHYEGYSYYDDETQTFRLKSGYGTWSGGYGTWSGGYGTWSGGYSAWNEGYGTWSGGYGTWSGGYGTWSGGYGTWSGGYGTWSGGYGTWSGGYGTWSGSEPWAGTVYADPTYVADYLAGVSPDPGTASTTIGQWLSEP